jgi:nitrite reductase (NADH) small subunit
MMDTRLSGSEGWTAVATADDVPPGTGRVVNVDGHLVALFNAGGGYHAIDNQCPHRGGPLGKGALDAYTVVCPWHGWSFDVRTGVNVDTGRIRVACFPVAVAGGQILIRVGGGQGSRERGGDTTDPAG